jgi:hypothetical protein
VPRGIVPGKVKRSCRTCCPADDKRVGPSPRPGDLRRLLRSTATSLRPGLLARQFTLEGSRGPADRRGPGGRRLRGAQLREPRRFRGSESDHEPVLELCAHRRGLLPRDEQQGRGADPAKVVVGERPREHWRSLVAEVQRASATCSRNGSSGFMFIDRKVLRVLESSSPFRNRGRFDLPPGPGDPRPVTDDDVASLPQPAQRYLRFMGVVGRPRDWSFRARLVGGMRSAPGKPWMHSVAWQYNTSLAIARIFDMRIDFGGVLPMFGSDTYVAGRGRMFGSCSTSSRLPTGRDGSSIWGARNVYQRRLPARAVDAA